MAQPGRSENMVDASGRVYVAMLRAVNVGGRNRISMPSLAALFAALPAEDVSTYVQSGNVVFRSSLPADAAVAGEAERLIRSRLGLDVTVIVVDLDELSLVVADNPYLGTGRDEATLHLTLLAAEPDPGRVAAASTAASIAATGGDECAVRGRSVYVHCPDGYGRTRLNNAFFEKKLGTPGTTRNWRSITTMAEMAKTLAGGRGGNGPAEGV